MPIPHAFNEYLNLHKVAYEVIRHRRDYTAQQTAADTHTKGKSFAKTVIVFADNQYYMVVLPATYLVSLEKVKNVLNAGHASLATEDEIAQICSDCEVGAMPPFGTLYELPVYVSHHLAEDHMITFNAGTHEDVIRILYKDFETLAKPNVANITVEH